MFLIKLRKFGGGVCVSDILGGGGGGRIKEGCTYLLNRQNYNVFSNITTTKTLSLMFSHAKLHWKENCKDQRTQQHEKRLLFNKNIFYFFLARFSCKVTM